MTDYSQMDEATLNEKLNEAANYEERAVIRKALRQLKREQGKPVGRTTRREATYNRFAGKSSTTTKTVVGKSFIAKEGACSPARGPTPTQKTSSSHSPVTYSPLPSNTPPPIHTPSPTSPQLTVTTATVEETDSIPPHTEEPQSPQSPHVPPSPSPPLSPPRSPTPPPSPPITEKFQEEVVDGNNEEEVIDGNNEEEVEAEEEVIEDTNEGAEHDVTEETIAESDEGVKVVEDTEIEIETEEADNVHDTSNDDKPAVSMATSADDKPAISMATDSADDPDGSLFGKKVHSRRPDTQTSKVEERGKAEFQGFKLRRTLSQDQQVQSPPGGSGNRHDFGIKLKSRGSPATTDVLSTANKTDLTSQLRSRSKTFGSGEGRQTSSSSSSGAPRTLRDYQQLSARSQRSKVKSPDDGDSEEGTTLPVDELQRYLVVYVNQELGLTPAIPSRGKALYDICSQPINLCKLINKSVKHTVDLRALTTITTAMTSSEKEEAIQENMTLTIESARAIGCRITDSTADLIISKDPTTIRSFIVDLIRARVVNMPGMDDEPTKTFTNLSILFSKLGITENVDGEGEEEKKGEPVMWREDTERVRKVLKTPPKSPPTGISWRDMDKPSSPNGTEGMLSGLTYEERAAQRRAEREKREQERMRQGATDTSGLTYEERAAMRRAERERKRQERAELAGSQ